MDGVFVELLLGTDIVEVDRIKTAIENGQNGRFLNRVFTANEIKYCESKKASKYQSYAARFAGKEAVSKAFGTGIGKNASFDEIEILNNELGKPSVTLHGRAKDFYSSLEANGISITLSHSREYAVAYVVILVG